MNRTTPRYPRMLAGLRERVNELGYAVTYAESADVVVLVVQVKLRSPLDDAPEFADRAPVWYQNDYTLFREGIEDTEEYGRLAADALHALAVQKAENHVAGLMAVCQGGGLCPN